jgi:hypothetical protein
VLLLSFFSLGPALVFHKWSNDKNFFMAGNKFRLNIPNAKQNVYDGTVIVTINIADDLTPWKQAAQDEERSLHKVGSAL